MLGALTVAAELSPPAPALTVLVVFTDLIDIGDSSVLTEVTVRRNILGEWMRARVKKPEKEGEELSSWPWLSLPCRRVCLRGGK